MCIHIYVCISLSLSFFSLSINLSNNILYLIKYACRLIFCLIVCVARSLVTRHRRRWRGRRRRHGTGAGSPSHPGQANCWCQEGSASFPRPINLSSKVLCDFFICLICGSEVLVFCEQTYVQTYDILLNRRIAYADYFIIKIWGDDFGE